MANSKCIGLILDACGRTCSTFPARETGFTKSSTKVRLGAGGWSKRHDGPGSHTGFAADPGDLKFMARAWGAVLLCCIFFTFLSFLFFIFFSSSVN